MKVEVKCSWCNGFMGWKEFEFSAREEIQHPITHGICKKCLAKEMVEIKAMSTNNNKQMKGARHDADSNTGDCSQ